MSIDLIRGALAGLLFLIGVCLWNDWQAAHPVMPAPEISAAHTLPANNLGSIPQNTNSSIAASAVSESAPTQHLQPIAVETDVLQIKIDPMGGALIGANLTDYPNSLQDKSPLTLFNQKAESFYTAQSGLTSPLGPDNTEAGVYEASQTHYEMTAGQQQLIVPLTWHNKQGLTVTKTFTFTRGSYVVHVAFSIENNMTQPWQGQWYAQLKRSNTASTSHSSFLQVSPFSGAVISTPEKRYEKLSYSDLTKEPVNQSITNGWMAMEQHYFLSAWIPDAKQTLQYSSQVFDSNKLYAVNMVSPTFFVAPKQNKTIESNLYVGPAIASQLAKVAPGLDLTVDYGFLWPIGVVLFWLMDHIHHYVGNWGWSIVLLTVLIKLCFFKLSATSYKSMAAMRKLQPQLQQIKERYGDDRQKVGQLTMELYKKEKVNPMGGCLPLLVQIPVFFALYWVLFASVQLRLAPFVLWIHDLAMPDPFYILPILMGATMFLQQRMSPPPPDPMQAKLMMAMPLVMTFFFLTFPSGLVLYWVVSNTISIVQQWVITRRYK